VQVNSVTYSPETFKGGINHNHSIIIYNINSNDTITYYQEGLKYSTFDGTAGLWNPLITSNPEQLTFWFDFSESEYSSQIGKYGANKIQQRSKVTSDEHITALYYGDTLNIAWEYSGEDEEKYNQLNPYLHEAEYPIFNIPDFFKSSFKSSSKAKSCKDVLISWLQNYTYANESLNFSALPIYTLQPNELIQINNSIYRVNSISIPLSYNGTMSVQAVKEVDLFYKEEDEDNVVFKNLDFHAERLNAYNYESSIRTSNVTLFNSEEAWNQNWEIEFLASTSENIPQGGEGAGTTVGIIGSSRWNNRQIAIQVAVGTNATLVDTFGLSSVTGSKRLEVPSTNKIIKVKKDFRIFSGQLWAIFQLYINEELMHFGEGENEKDYFARERI
jgi:hypothetical protein